MGSIQRIERPKPWRARYRGPDGREHSRAFRRKVDAERWLRTEEGKADQGVWLDPTAGNVNFADYAERWLAGRALKPATAAGYRSLLDSRILPEFGGLPLNRVTRDSVRAWIAGLVAEGLSPSRINQAQSLMATIYRQAVDDGLVGRNPALGVATPRKRPRRQLYLTPNQVEQLAGECESRQDGAGGLVRFLAWSGLRWGEAVALRCKNVDIDQRRVRVRESATEVRGELVLGEPKTHEHRTVIVPRHALPSDSDCSAPENLVFPGPKGGHLRSAHFRRSVWQPAVAASDVPAGLLIHDLRDTAASLAIASGASIKAVQRMLGHASAAMTLDTYGSLYDEDLEDLADRLEARFNSSVGTQGAQAAASFIASVTDQRRNAR